MAPRGVQNFRAPKLLQTNSEIPEKILVKESRELWAHIRNFGAQLIKIDFWE